MKGSEQINLCFETDLRDENILIIEIISYYLQLIFVERHDKISKFLCLTTLFLYDNIIKCIIGEFWHKL